MDVLGRLKAKIEAQDISKEVDLAKLEKLASIEKTLVEIDKIKEDIDANSRNKKRIHVWLPFFAPILTALTLLFTVYQFNRNFSLQRQSIEESEWRSFLPLLNDKENINSNLVVPITLKSFFKSERYGLQAKNIALAVLPDIENNDVFSSIFQDVFKEVNEQNFNDLSLLSKNIIRAKNRMNSMIDIQNNIIRDSSNNKRNDALIFVNSHNPLVYNVNLEIVSDAAIRFLRGDRKRPEKMDLSFMEFHSKDLKNIDFGNAILSNTKLYGCSLDGADLNKVTDFLYSEWNSSTWWRAKNISDKLLLYLVEDFPLYKTKDDYGYRHADNEDIKLYESYYQRWQKLTH